jgi:hypothetical protein
MRKRINILWILVLLSGCIIDGSGTLPPEPMSYPNEECPNERDYRYHWGDCG